MKRHHAPGVRALEVWDVVLDGAPLYLLAEQALPSAIVALVRALQQGSARRLRADLALPRLRVDRVLLGGGGVTEPACAALSRANIEARVHPDPVWIGEAGARALCAQAVLEIGQTSVKYSDLDGRVRLARPLDRVPLESASRSLDRALLRARTLEFLASAAQGRRRPASLVLAMPCELGDDLRVAGCSYPWTDGDPRLIADLLALAGLDDVPTRVLNDAELAAVAAQQLCGPHTLVLTLGLGLGGAYLDAP
ncbi:MAG: hypothetical protein ABW352_20635 [Polyangiales bacterium]